MENTEKKIEHMKYYILAGIVAFLVLLVVLIETIF
jgi:hypothetical protein